MKLNDFVNKKRVRQASSSPRFILDNSALESKYKEQIDDLNTKLSVYRNMEADRDAALRKLGAEVNYRETLESENTTFKEEMKVLRTTVSDQENFLLKIPELKKEINKLSGIKESNIVFQETNSSLLQEITALKSTIQNQETKLQTLNKLQEAKTVAEHRLVGTKEELDTMTATTLRQSNDISSLGQQAEKLKNENESFSKELIQNRADKISAEEERKQVLEENKKLKTFADETSKISIEVQKQNNKLREEINFWEKESEAITSQLKESVRVYNELRKWVTNLENENTKSTSIKNALTKNVAASKSTIAEKVTVIEGLLSENTYLRRVNSDFRKELLKPKYLSMGAIAKREGFKMPQGMENIRTQNLGNAAPTLLKFNPKKENSYGN
tara:strand:+ start:877 stop:2037 length:1161 start_codon:yes stop_codon:yes gene_type:complete